MMIMLVDIPSAPGYMASSDGRIFNSKGPMKPFEKPNGYLQIPLRIGGEYKTKLVHRLVAEAYHGTNGLDVNHRDGVKSNNEPKNLEYVTKSENSIHSSEVLGNNLKPVQLVKGGVGYWWPSQKACIQDTHLAQQSVSALHSGARKTAHGWSTTMFNEMRY